MIIDMPKLDCFADYAAQASLAQQQSEARSYTSHMREHALYKQYALGRDRLYVPSRCID